MKARQERDAAWVEAEQVRQQASEERSAAEAVRRELEESRRQLADLRKAVRLAGLSRERLETLRQELTASRRRNEDVVASEHVLRSERDHFASQRDQYAAERDCFASERDQYAAERDHFSSERDQYASQRDRYASERDQYALERDDYLSERDHYALKFHTISESTIWKATWPVRRLASKLPPGVRRGLRSAAHKGWWLATLQRRRGAAAPVPEVAASDRVELTAPPVQEPPAEQPPAEQPLAEQPLEQRPSDLQRLHDPAWVAPHERPEFIRLRGLRPKVKIAVVAHVFYVDLWPEMMEAIGNIPEDFDLFVTLVVGVSDSLASAVREQFPDAHVLYVDNHGRDMFPFLALVRTGALFQYELVCKIHTKRSPSREGSDEWRKCLITGVLGSARLVQRIVGAFRSDPDLGIVFADGQTFGGRANWVSNEPRSRQLFRDIGLSASAFEHDFVGGSIYWIRPLILRTIDALRLDYDDFEPEPLPDDGCTAHAVERLVSIVGYDAGMRVGESGRLAPPRPNVDAAKVHVIANYLPQFPPVPENDEPWGPGFTEWSNVTKALPLFRGHRQPRLPADLGFYDLRLLETRRAQAELARRYGVTAFSYYYYWFNGRRLLNRPIDAVVASGDPDFPFMLCWANEPWSRNWDGLAKEVLIPQDYAPGWERSFAADAAPIMRDPRYLRLNGKPILALYRVAHFPDTVGSIVRLRTAFSQEGFHDVHLVGGWPQLGEDDFLPPEAGELGLDAYVEFPPHGIPAAPLEVPGADRAPGFAAQTYDYGATVDAVLDQLAADQTFRYHSVMMGWDNTARIGIRSFVFHCATPTNFRRWLRAAVRRARSEASGPETAVFINAWNEWAEGTYLEPDRDFGTGWLEAVASATTSHNRKKRHRPWRKISFFDRRE